MTETSPVCAISDPPGRRRINKPDDVGWRLKTGRIIPGVEVRIMGLDGQ